MKFRYLGIPLEEMLLEFRLRNILFSGCLASGPVLVAELIYPGLVELPELVLLGYFSSKINVKRVKH